MSREWKPGDIGVHPKFGYRSIYVEGCSQHGRPQGAGCWHNESSFSDAEDSPRRPLVVIDPESAEDVARLADAFCNARWSHMPGSDECDPLTRSSMKAALREFANPKPPKPDEPLGLGAVVEDTGGRRYVRTGSEGWEWYREGDGPTSWNFVDAARIVSEGVMPS